MTWSRCGAKVSLYSNHFSSIRMRKFLLSVDSPL